MPRLLEYDESCANVICERIAAGESVIQITRDDEMPAQSTVYKWLSKVPEFAEKYTRAREMQMEAMAQEILDIADDTRHDTRIIRRGEAEIEVENGEWINRCRLQVDTRKWLMSKLAPKKYGERIQQEHTGEGGGPIQIVSNIPRPPQK